MSEVQATDDFCAYCGGPKAIRNPSGACDHLYWPDCLTTQAKLANGILLLPDDLRTLSKDQGE
jgi:hypothetical protein